MCKEEDWNHETKNWNKKNWNRLLSLQSKNMFYLRTLGYYSFI